MSALQAKVLPFDTAANNNNANPTNGVALNILGLPRISDDEHFRRAMRSDAPLSYVAARAGRMEFGGEDGMGALNAEAVMVNILRLDGFTADAGDAQKANAMNGTLRCAVERLNRFYPEDYARQLDHLPRIRVSTTSHGFSHS